MTEKKRFGFGSWQAETTELEVPVKLEFRQNQPEKTLLARGEEFMEIFIGGRSHAGIYRGLTEDGCHVIRPSMFPGPRYLEEKSFSKDRYIWRNEPSFHRGDIEGFRPMDKQILENVAGGFERVEKLGKYMPSDEAVKSDIPDPAQADNLQK